MYCVYCRKEVSTPHRCDNYQIHPTAHTRYVSGYKEESITADGRSTMTFDAGRSTVRNQRD